MPTANECRQYAQDCLLLATTAIDFYAQDALIRLAADFEKMAEGLQQNTINPEDPHLSDWDSHSWRSHAVGRK